ISYETKTLAEAQELAKGNTDRKLNFIRIEKDKNRLGRSFMRQLGSNTGHWLVSDGLGESSTAPHENAHGLGLEHESDQRGRGIPNIMAARGTLVNSEYQYDPKAKSGAKGGTVNPIYRRVRNGDIQKIINNIKTDSNGNNYIGSPKIDNTLLDKTGHDL
ncbi:zinc metalloprotease, partial [Apibacter adventoris]